MTNMNGIAAVTETLRYMLSQHATEFLANTSVNINPPEELKVAGPNVINLFLYNVTQTASGRNADVPTRNGAGQLIHDPVLELELDYLISVTGKANTPDAEALIGFVLTTFHAVPAIAPQFVHEAAKKSSTKFDPSSINGGIEIYPLNLSIEERSKLWSVFFQVPYKLSIEYRARAAIVAADLSPLARAPRPKTVVPSAGTLRKGHRD